MQFQPPHAIEGDSEHGARIDQNVVGPGGAVALQGRDIGKALHARQERPAALVAGIEATILTVLREDRWIVIALLALQSLHVDARHMIGLHGILDIDLPIAAEFVDPKL
jgi:hypothetical protein